MSSSPERERSLASEATRLVLDRVGLRTYLFGVERADGGWIVDVEHPVGGAWQRVVLEAPHEALIATLDDPRRREAMARLWRPRLEQRSAA